MNQRWECLSEQAFLWRRGDLPAVFGRVHPETGAPGPAIILTAVLAIGLTLSGTFEDLLVLGVVARFAQYIPTTLAVLVLRRRPDFDKDAGYTIPGGPLIPLITIGLCGWLLYNSDPKKLMMVDSSGCWCCVLGPRTGG